MLELRDVTDYQIHTPDTIAETTQGLSDYLYSVLWTVGNDDGLTIADHWGDFTPEQQTALLKAAEGLDDIYTVFSKPQW